MAEKFRPLQDAMGFRAYPLHGLAWRLIRRKQLLAVLPDVCFYVRETRWLTSMLHRRPNNTPANVVHETLLTLRRCTNGKAKPYFGDIYLRQVRCRRQFVKRLGDFRNEIGRKGRPGMSHKICAKQATRKVLAATFAIEFNVRCKFSFLQVGILLPRPLTSRMSHIVNAILTDDAS